MAAGAAARPKQLSMLSPPAICEVPATPTTGKGPRQRNVADMWGRRAGGSQPRSGSVDSTGGDSLSPPSPCSRSGASTPGFSGALRQQGSVDQPAANPRTHLSVSPVFTGTMPMHSLSIEALPPASDTAQIHESGTQLALPQCNISPAKSTEMLMQRNASVEVSEWGASGRSRPPGVQRGRTLIGHDAYQGPPSSRVFRPTLHKSRVDSFEDEHGYFRLNQYKLMAEIAAPQRPPSVHGAYDRCRLSTQPSAPHSQQLERAAAATATLDTPKTSMLSLGTYRILEQTNFTPGSYGIVKLAYNEQDRNHYAMKILDKRKLMKKFAFFRKPPPRRAATVTSDASGAPRVSQAPDPLAQVYREIAILKKLCHPNVVKLVEVLDDPNDHLLHMVFEYMSFGCVMEVPTEDPLGESTAWRYFRDTLLGLEYLHHQKIVHRDIKPSNLLLSETGTVKIADFGVSTEFEGLDAFLSGTAGTPAFMAPEALNEGAVTFYSGRAHDIWSLGITLYSFVYGNVPFREKFVIALYKQIKTEPVVFQTRPKISAELRNLIENMLQKEPEQRITLREIKEHDWVTSSGANPLPSELDNCRLVTVTDDEIRNSVRVIFRLDTLILIKAMGQRRSFGNPFRPTKSATAERSRPRGATENAATASQIIIADLEPCGENSCSRSAAGDAHLPPVPPRAASARPAARTTASLGRSDV